MPLCIKSRRISVRIIMIYQYSIYAAFLQYGFSADKAFTAVFYARYTGMASTFSFGLPIYA